MSTPAEIAATPMRMSRRAAFSPPMRNPFRTPSLVGILAKWLFFGALIAAALLAALVVIGNLTDDDFGHARTTVKAARFEEPPPVAMFDPIPIAAPTPPALDAPSPATTEAAHAKPRPQPAQPRKQSAGIIRSAPY